MKLLVKLLVASLFVVAIAVPTAERMVPGPQVDDIALVAVHYMDPSPRSSAYEEVFTAPVTHGETAKQRAVATVERRVRNVPGIG
jgi:hypothetical protein